LSAESDEIMYTTTGDVGIYYDDSGETLYASYHAIFTQVICLIIICGWAI